MVKPYDKVQECDSCGCPILFDDVDDNTLFAYKRCVVCSQGGARYGIPGGAMLI